VAGEFLRWALCDITGGTLAPLYDRREGKVEIQGSGHRTASVNLPLSESAVSLIEPLRTLLKVWTSSGRCIFAGPIATPVYQGREQRVTLTALNPVFRLERRVVRHDFSGTNPQGLIIESLISTAVENTTDEFAAGIPGLGIEFGQIDAGPTRTVDWKRGHNAWSAITDLEGLDLGPELDFNPVDRDDGILAELNILNRQGTDRSDDVHFEFNWGRNNCNDFVFSPDGLRVLNRYSTQGQAASEGELPPLDRQDYLTGQIGVGIYEGFETWTEIDDPSEHPLLKGRSMQMVAAYGNPPPFFTVVPANEQLDEGLGKPPLIFEDYGMGDTISAVAQMGVRLVELTGRVRTITVNEVDPAGNLRTDLAIVPTVIEDLE
jgi:hypothetical protein